jgi:hypothetical protein
VLPGGAKACRSCGEPLPIGTAKKKDLLQPKMSLEEVLQKTNTDVVRAPLPIKRIFLFSILICLALGAIFVIKSAMVIFDGSGKEYQEKIFYDPVFGLMWAKAKTEPLLYQDAEKYCAEMRIGQIDDWRIPNATELRSIIKGCPGTDVKGKCAVHDACFNPDCQTEQCKGCEAEKGTGDENLYWQPRIWEHTPGWSKGFFWSSTEKKEMVGDEGKTTKEYWTVSFVTGAVDGKESEIWGHVRCVSGPVSAKDRLKQYFMFMK